ncbi:hypothetical protein ONZ45_g7348 [Pleurotus djamor]|nr:hypothetical protein ONZ45_g7348 [Pleurotus djamor]
MNLRQALGSVVVLACVLYVQASPVLLTEDKSYDIEARSYEGALEPQLRGLPLAVNYDFPEHDEISSVYRRAPPVGKARPKKQPTIAAPAPVTPKNRPSVPPPASGPPTPQRKPSTPAPAPPNKRPMSPGPGPAPLPPNKRPSSPGPAPVTPNPAPKPPLGGTQQPGTPPTRPSPPGRVPPNQKPPQNQASCTVRRRGILTKRAFNINCPTASLTLGGATRAIQKLEGQGKSAVTYQVVNGWPDPYTGQNVLAFAKTAATDQLTTEATWLNRVGQLLASGQYDGRNFIVLRGAPGGDINGCKAEVRRSLIPQIVADAQHYVAQFHVLHRDIHPDNVLFDERFNPIKATLIDWGLAEQQPVWTAALADRVRAQADRTFLESEETRICVQW